VLAAAAPAAAALPAAWVLGAFFGACWVRLLAANRVKNQCTGRPREGNVGKRLLAANQVKNQCTGTPREGNKNIVPPKYCLNQHVKQYVNKNAKFEHLIQICRVNQHFIPNLHWHALHQLAESTNT
jgi:hypothetical protein